MSIHPPRTISSYEGLGLNTTKKLTWVSNSVAYGSETWNELEKPWMLNDTIIALPGYVWRTRWEIGKPYVITKYIDDKGKLIGIYCDICRPVTKFNNGLMFDDLYLDVWQLSGSKPIFLDEDELNESVKNGYLSSLEASEARHTADAVMQLLVAGTDLLNF